MTDSGDVDSGGSSSVVVVSKITPEDLKFDKDGVIIISDEESRLDALDDFNHPRIRRSYILRAFQNAAKSSSLSISFETPSSSSESSLSLQELYKDTQNVALLKFLESAWQQWSDLGEQGRDPMASLNSTTTQNDKKIDNTHTNSIPALIPGNTPLPRDPHQRPSRNVMGQMGYYCTDNCTPIFGQLLSELQEDAAIVQHALQLATSQPQAVVYAIPTHPGHHAATDSFGGYCYLNQAAHAAQTLLQQQNAYERVAILDIDYHCGNGTASIFYNHPHVLVASIHCHPDHDYPFHSGFTEDNNETTYHAPLPPGATWEQHYQPALAQCLDRIFDQFQAHALIVSMGLDTLQGDPVTLRRAGFAMTPPDYTPLGRMIGSRLHGATSSIPCLVLQEGGYKMNELGPAAADVVLGIAEARQQQTKELS
ncbi:Acetylpolyamine amidohydrolase 2 [Seminavis robusta]|uniref:Acetylpolyamine amidohydrolase 2 n=1 Tax=Seminavis robusta TaxID=568900 RepID=A0A9N8DCV2_9STRA|nr:Acetylpolyamine amidohydrolase 2 [Seminavis robusta]|eukprot:Sro32_g021070.1 Acetylpolyamine amidohydrolase 2 (424) ;mRNA; r:147808-149079